jgi:hypothetical protein
VLSFDAPWGPQALPGFSGNTVVTPMACRTTPAYTAQANEVAIIHVHGTGSPTAAVTDILYIVPMVSTNGGANFTSVLAANTDSAESLQDGTANASVTKRYPLIAGTSYIFAAGFASNSALTINPGYCQGVVMIVKQ